MSDTEIKSRPRDTHSFPANDGVADVRCRVCNKWESETWGTSCRGPVETKIHIQVIFFNELEDFIPVPEGEGWKIDACRRLLIVGKGLGRVMVPLENIRHFGPVKK